MKVTTEMIDAAMKKATEAGLLPRHVRREDASINRELIRMVLTAALEGGRNRTRAGLTKASKEGAADAQEAQAAGDGASRFSEMPKFPNRGVLVR